MNISDSPRASDLAKPLRGTLSLDTLELFGRGGFPSGRSVEEATVEQINESHCQSCGRKASGSYSECCNELIVGGRIGPECAPYAEGGDCFHK